MKKQIKIMLSAMIAASFAGGAASAAESLPFPTGNVTVTQDTDYVSAHGTVQGNVSITCENSSRPDVSVSEAAHAPTPEGKINYHGVIWVNGNHEVNISNLGTLNINSDKENDADCVGAYISSGNTVFNVTNVDTVNIGTAANPFKGAYGLMTQDGDINIGTAENKVGNVNIFTTDSGICGQHSTSDSYGVEINASGNVTIHGEGAAVQSMSLDGTHNSGILINADGKISLEAGKYGAIEAFDTSANYKGDGQINVCINGKDGVDISSQSDNGIYMSRKSEKEANLTITSSDGDVNIKGTTGFFSSAVEGANNTVNITGQNINIHSTEGSGNTRPYGSTGSTIDMLGNSNLTLAVNQAGGKITVSTDKSNGNVINVSGNNSSLKLGDGNTATDVNINGYVNVSGTGSSLTFADKTTTHVDGKYLANTERAFITAGTNDNSVSFNGSSELVIDHAQTGRLNFSDNSSINQNFKKLIDSNRVTTDNLLQNVTFNGNEMTVGTVDKAEAAELLGGSALTNVALAATDQNLDGVTALITNNASDTDAVKTALNSAAGLSGLANVAHGTYTMNGLFSDAVSGHLMNRQDQDVWAYGFHSKENVNGLSFGGDYDAQYNGVTAGVDLYKNGGTTAGVALTYGDSNVSGSNGFATTKSDSDYYGASIYGRFDRGSYALLGDISYMKGDHDVTQVNSGETITASPDSDSISVGVKALKDYAAGENGTLTPYVGLRYLRLSTDDFTASNGLHYVGDDQDMVIVPVGVNYTASISHGKWSVRPYAGIGYVWTAGDRSADQTVMLGTAADSFSYDTADSSSFIARVGVTTDCDDMSYGIGYSWQKGDSVSNNAWTVSASYHF